MLRKTLCMLLSALLIVLLAISVSFAQTFTMAGFDGENSSRDWETNRFFTRMENRTGVSFTYQQFTSREKWQAAKNNMFATGELPDVFFKGAFSSDELIRYTESGQLIDLLPLLEENAPNLWALLQENPDWLAAITLPNGKVGALPALQENGIQNAIWINGQWLDDLGLEMPTDLDSLSEVLKAFRTRDANGNGKKDEITLSFIGPWDLKFFSHAWGVVVNDYNIYLAEDGKVHYWPEEDSFFEMVAKLHEMYEDGTLDSNGFTTADTLRRITDSDAAAVYGAVMTPSPMNLMPYDMAVKYRMVPPFSYEGKQIYRDLTGGITRGTFAITSACADPAALLRWVDVLYTEEGAIEAMAGIEGEDYELDENGYWNWVGGLTNISMDEYYSISVYETGDMPWMFPNEFYARYSESEIRIMQEETMKFNEYVVAPFPPYTLTAEENERVAALQSVLGVYVDESLARFVIGEVPLNEATKAEFLDGLKQRGCDDMVSFWQGIADK